MLVESVFPLVFVICTGVTKILGMLEFRNLVMWAIFTPGTIL